jgi:hypothetical protein
LVTLLGLEPRDHLIESFPVAAFSLTKSMMAVANFKRDACQKRLEKRGFGNRNSVRGVG